jgi:hypothetical protein
MGYLGVTFTLCSVISSLTNKKIYWRHTYQKDSFSGLSQRFSKWIVPMHREGDAIIFDIGNV